MELEEESHKYVAINTYQGLYQFTRVPYGISSAPTLFQKTMDTILQGKKKVICSIDDILIMGGNDQEHLWTLADVLETLTQHRIKIKRQKCEFLKDVEILGHKIDFSGIHADPGKMEDIAKVPRPKNQQQLKSFLGLFQYYGKFLSNLSSLLHSLNNLLQSTVGRVIFVGVSFSQILWVASKTRILNQRINGRDHTVVWAWSTHAESRTTWVIYSIQQLYYNVSL